MVDSFVPSSIIFLVHIFAIDVFSMQVSFIYLIPNFEEVVPHKQSLLHLLNIILEIFLTPKLVPFSQQV